MTAPTPRIRHRPEDFEVEEIALYPPGGEGGFLFLWIEKVDRNTHDIARDLARELGVGPREVGFAGRKDRRAVTRQWFSVHLPEAEAEIDDLELEGARILEATRHDHRLRTGQLTANRFRLVIRDVGPEQAADASERLAGLLDRGMPNRFGAQRFGKRGDNPEVGARILRGERVRMNRRAQRFQVSALQSAVFNRALELRPVDAGTLLTGDLAVIHSSGGVFWVDDAEAEQPRADSLELSPSGPIFGRKMRRPRGEVDAYEVAAMKEWDLDPDALPRVRGLPIRGTRRPLRVPITGATLEPGLEPETLELAVELPAGSYVTVLLDELFPGGWLEGEREG